MFANINILPGLIWLSAAFAAFTFSSSLTLPDGTAFKENCRRIAISLHSSKILTKARQLKKRHDYNQAIALYRKYLATTPENTDARAEFAFCLNGDENFGAALKQSDLVLQVRPDDIAALSNKAWALNHMKRYEEALKTAQLALSNDKNDGESWCARGEALMGLGRLKEAAQALERHRQIHGAEYYSEELRKNLYACLGTKMPEAK
jgi:Flp pilus assembly protein TadD